MLSRHTKLTKLKVKTIIYLLTDLHPSKTLFSLSSYNFFNIINSYLIENENEFELIKIELVNSKIN